MLLIVAVVFAATVVEIGKETDNGLFALKIQLFQFTARFSPQKSKTKSNSVVLILLFLQRDASELCFIINIDPLEMKKEKTTNQEAEVEFGDFGPIYRQFAGKPQKAIEFLRKQQTGECIKALHRDDIGDISIVWGKVTDPIKHKGYGLSHIIDKHEEGIKKLGFRIEDFIPIIVQFGSIKESDSKEEFLFESNYYRIVVEKRYKGLEKQWVLTVFDLRKKPRK